MLDSYLTLGLEFGVGNEEIRKRYLELIKRSTPEKDPERFQEITRAYERIKTSRLRVQTKLYGIMDDADVDSTLMGLSRAKKPLRRRANLQELLAEARKQHL